MKWLGLVLSAIGGVLTIVGLIQSKIELFPRDRPVRARYRRGRAVAYRLWRRLLRHPPQNQTIVAGVATVALGGVTSTARAYVSYNEPTIEQRLDELTARLDILTEQHVNTVKVTAEHTRRADDMDRELRAAIAELTERIPQAVGGKNGRGLRLAWIGVAIGLLGTIVTTVWG